MFSCQLSIKNVIYPLFLHSLFILHVMSSTPYGDIHRDPQAFKEAFQKSHQKNDKIGDNNLDSSELFDNKKEDDVFYWFSLHDYDHNEKLDGLELRSAWMNSDPSIYTLTKAEEIVDNILENDDLNNDGFIDWEEYLANQSGQKK
jgi:hypothetical protein